MDAELFAVADELHFTRILVAQRGYGKLSRFDVSSNSRLSSLVIYNEFVFVEVKAYIVTIFALHHDDDLIAGV